MKNALKACLFIVCFLLLVSASPSLANGFDTTKRRLVVAAEATYPPFTIIDKDGKPTGFSIELLREVAKAVNLELDIGTETENTCLGISYRVIILGIKMRWSELWRPGKNILTIHEKS